MLEIDGYLRERRRPLPSDGIFLARRELLYNAVTRSLVSLGCFLFVFFCSLSFGCGDEVVWEDKPRGFIGFRVFDCWCERRDKFRGFEEYIFLTCRVLSLTAGLLDELINWTLEAVRRLLLSHIYPSLPLNRFI